MLAAVLQEFGSPLVIEDLTEGTVGPHAVRVRIEATGLCHSDATIATGAMPIPLPVVLGHEAAGTVVEVGRDVTRAEVGNRVIVALKPACGACWFCRHTHAEHCTSSPSPAVLRRGDRSEVYPFVGLGTFAEFACIDEQYVVRVETTLPDEQLALIGCCVVTGVGATLNTIPVRPGQTVAVVGAGGVGQCVIQGARLAGAARIFAIDPVASKRKFALRNGATDAIDPSSSDAVAILRNETDGRGVDIAYEVVGRSDTLETAYNGTRNGGSVGVIGLPADESAVPVSVRRLLGEGKRIVGCMYGSAQVGRDFPLLVELAESGRLDLGALVSHRIALGDINAGFDTMASGEAIRVVALPHRDESAQ